jgi:hypothetical protein
VGPWPNVDGQKVYRVKLEPKEIIKTTFILKKKVVFIA